MTEEISLTEYLKAVGPKHKYFATRTEVDGIWFDSKAEGKKYSELVILQRVGKIANLKVHPVFPIIVNEIKICDFIPDFSFMDLEKGEPVILDVKSRPTLTPMYRLKKKLFIALYRRTVTEEFR